MEIKEKATALVGDLKLHLALAAVIGVAGIALATAGPTLASVVTFFWPLLVSTVFLLAAVAVLFRISPPPRDPLHEEVPGQELMQYVAGCPDEVSCEMPVRSDRASQAEEGEGERELEEERREAL